MMLMSSYQTLIPSLGVIAFIGYEAQAKLVELQTLRFGFNTDDAAGTQGIGIWLAPPIVV